VASGDDRHPHLRRAAQHRGAHRARSHESAHAEVTDEAQAQLATSDHALAPKGAAVLISDAEGLSELLNHLRSAGSFAYDSEFIGELTYIPKLCLIQVATTQRVALIDPLAGLDLDEFWELICEASVEKILHAGQQDVEPAIRHRKKRAENLFDTQIGAGFVGMSYPVALAKLVNELTGARLGKGLTFTHWDQRPLSAVQLRYAEDDVRYLPAVRAELGKRLSELGHESFAREESNALGDPELYRFNPDVACQRIRGASGLSPVQLAILRELCVMRDAAAREADVPPRAFLRDEVLVDLARSPAKSVEKLSRVRGLPRPIEASHGQAIVEATLKAMSLPVAELPTPKQSEESPSDRFRVDSLWIAAQAIAAGRGIDANLVSSRQEIGELFRRLMAKKDVSALPITSGWRNECVGKPLLELFRGQVRAAIEWKDGLSVKPAS